MVLQRANRSRFRSVRFHVPRANAQRGAFRQEKTNAESQSALV